jgi:hypothetical protein
MKVEDVRICLISKNKESNFILNVAIYYTVEPVYNDIGLCHTLPITSDIL